MVNFLQRLSNWFKPQYNELMAFQIAVLWTATWFAFPELRSTYEKAWSNTGALFAWVIGISLILLIGIIFSIWNIFVERKKSLIEKYFMGTYIMLVNGLVGIAAGIELFPKRLSIMMIFPLWNIFIGIFLIYQAAIVETIVTDEDSPFLETGITTAISIIIFLIVCYGLRLPWGLTLSICLFYASLAALIIPWAIKYFNLEQNTKIKQLKNAKRPKL